MQTNQEQLGRKLKENLRLNFLFSISTNVLAIPRRWLILLCLTILAIYALFLRFLHLLDPGHYYLISVDSHLFHWLSGRVVAGEPGYLNVGATSALHSGLTYPLAYISEAFSFVFGISSSDALDIVCKLIPPIVGIITLILIYMTASRTMNLRSALFSVFAWVIIGSAVLIGAAGYIDRDGLSMLLIMTGILIFCFSRGWKFSILGKDVGWFLTGVGILLIEGIVFLYWSFVGAVLILAPIIVYFAIRLLLGYFDHLEEEPSVRRRLNKAIRTVNWPTFVFIIICNGLVAVVSGQASFWLTFMVDMIQVAGTEENIIAEMSGITPGHILRFGFFLIPILLSLYLAWRRHSESTIFFACWFITMLVLSVFAQRVLLYSIPAACFLTGIGLAYLWNWMKYGQYRKLKKAGVILLLCVMILYSFTAYSLGSNPRTAVNAEWQDALTYIREETSQDSLIMTWWDWGYWILDLGQREPIVDNGYYGWDNPRLTDVATVYMTDDVGEAVGIMEKYNSKYFIMSTLDLDITKTIMRFAGVEEKYKGFETLPEETLMYKVLQGDFDNDGGLKVVYRSAPNSEVVILSPIQNENLS